MRSKKAIKNIISTLSLQIITIICGFIVPKLIIITYGSETNGLINSITQFLAYITLLESGFGPVVKSLLYKPIAKKNKNEIERILYASECFFRHIAMIFIIYIAILTVVFPVLVNKEFNRLYTISLILILSISTFAEYFFGMTYKLYLQAEQKTYITSYIQILTIILNTIFVVILIKLGANIQMVKLVTSLIFIIRPILQKIYIKNKYAINLNEVDKNYKIKQKWDGLAQHVAAVIHGNTDIAILTVFTSSKEVSVYSIYILIINGVKNLVNALTGGIDASFGDMIAKNEINHLNKKFKLYEFIYHTIASIAFICTIVLIVPFVSVYTNGINDVEYIRKTFAFIMVLAEFMWAIRLPYSSITLAAGHFKETQKGAWIEAFSNIIISIMLVFKLGMVGVAIGTLVSMTIRTVEFIYHSSKYILKRGSIKPLLKIMVIAGQMTIVLIISYFTINDNIINSYITWFVTSIKVAILTIIIVVPINCLIYKNQFKEICLKLKNIVINR